MSLDFDDADLERMLQARGQLFRAEFTPPELDELLGQAMGSQRRHRR